MVVFTTWYFMVALSFVFLFIFHSIILVSGQNELQITPSSGGSSVPAELVWDGGVLLTLEAPPNTFYSSNFESSKKVPFQTGDLSEVDPKPYGFNVFRQTIFPYVPLQSDLVDLRVIKMTMRATRGFVAKSDTSVLITFDRFAKGNDRMRGTLVIAANTPGGGQPGYSIDYGRDEFEIRRKGARISISLKYNVFLSDKLETPVGLTNYQGSPQPLSVWSSSLSLNSTLLTLTLDPQPSFNVSSYQSAAFHFTVVSADVYLAISRAGGWVFSLPVDSVDGSPRTFCKLDRTVIVENELLDGNQTVTISLEDPSADAFDPTVQEFESILLESIVLPDDSGINVSLKSYSTTSIVLNFYTNVSSFDIYRNIFVYISVPPVLLLSKEAGCGGATVNIAPSPGTVRGVGFSSLELTELSINENVTKLRVVIERDLFVQPESQPHPILVQHVAYVGTPVAENPIVNGFIQAVAATGILEVGSGGKYADIYFPTNTVYNIPEGVTERLSIVIPGSVVASGVTPIMQDVVFDIKSVQATFTVTFNGPTVGSVRIKDLWNATGNLMVWFIIRGDRWNPAAAVSWGYRRPYFYSNFFSAYNTNERPVLDFSKVRIDSNGKIAYVPFLSVSNISTNGEQRVLVHEISLLAEGGTSTFSSFLVLPTSPEDIVGTYSGAAEDVSVTSPTFITENDVRNGLVFSVTLRNQVFANLDYTHNSLIFSNPASLAPYVQQSNGTLDATGRVLTVRLPPLPAYDIYGPDGVGLRVPDSFFFEGVVPFSRIDGRINIKNLPGPVCSLNVSRSITEINVRQGDIPFFVKSDKPFWTNITNLGDLKRYVTGRSASRGALVEPVRIVDEFTLEMRVLKNNTYDIVASDLVSVTVSRFMFQVWEGCAGALSFEIGVQPGSVQFYDLPSTVTESFLRSNEIRSSFSLSNEQVVSPSFDMRVVATPKRSNSGLYHTFLNKRVVATQREGVEGVFDFTIPQLPTLDVHEIEEFSLIVPNTVLASNRSASYANNTVSVNPISEEIIIIYDEVVDEHVIVEGGFTIQFVAHFGQFVNASSIINTLTVSTSGSGQAADPGLFRSIFTEKAFTFWQNGSRLNITLPPYPGFNLFMGNLTVSFGLPGAAMASGLPPVPSAVRFYVVSQLPVLQFTGTALYGGSRDLITSSLELDVLLMNDLFTDTIDSSICPRQLQCVFVLRDDQRHMTIQIRASSEFTTIREVTRFAVVFPPSAFQNGAAPAVNSATVTIFPQGGILEEVIDLTRTYEESVFREGGLPSFTLRVTGDEFIPDTNAIIESLIQGVACTPARDQFDFCGRIRYLVNSVKLSDNNRAATVVLQRDYDFDIYLQQTVNLHVTGDAFLSKQAPIAREAIRFTIYPVAGTVFYSNAAVSASAGEIRNGDSPENPLDVAFTFALVGERWTADATTRILASIGVVPSTHPFGFSNNQIKSQLFAPAVISPNGRVALLRMRPVSAFDISTDETLTMNVNGDAVLSGLKPVLVSTANQFVINVGGSVISLVTPRTVWADDLAANGLILSIRSSAEWDTLAVSTSAIQSRGVVRSTSSVGQEPNGFSRYSTYASAVPDSMVMAPSLYGNIAPGDRVLSIKIPPNPKYSLLKEERIIVTLPTIFQQGSAKGAFTPEFLTISVLPQRRELLLMVRNPITVDSLSQRVASMLGIFVSRVVVKELQSYGDDQGLYSQAIVLITDLSVGGIESLSAAEATTRLYTSTRETREGCCNISAVYWASAPPSRDQLDIDLGLATPPEGVVRADNMMWVYVGLGILVAIGIGIFVWWRVYGAMMDSGRNRERREDPQANWQPLLYIPKESRGGQWSEQESYEMASQAALKVLSGGVGDAAEPEEVVARATSRDRHRLEGDPDEFSSGPSLGGGPRGLVGRVGGHKITLDVDDQLHAGQPTFLLHEGTHLRESDQQQVQAPSPDLMPMTEDDVVVYPERFQNSPEYRRMRQQLTERRRERKRQP